MPRTMAADTPRCTEAIIFDMTNDAEHRRVLHERSEAWSERARLSRESEVKPGRAIPTNRVPVSEEAIQASKERCAAAEAAVNKYRREHPSGSREP